MGNVDARAFVGGVSVILITKLRKFVTSSKLLHKKNTGDKIAQRHNLHFWSRDLQNIKREGFEIR